MTKDEMIQELRTLKAKIGNNHDHSEHIEEPAEFKLKGGKTKKFCLGCKQEIVPKDDNDEEDEEEEDDE